MLFRQAKSYAVDILVHLGKAVKPCGQCRALNANALITSVYLTLLCFNEIKLRSVGMRHCKLIFMFILGFDMFCRRYLNQCPVSTARPSSPSWQSV
jgi:hypothetical protein